MKKFLVLLLALGMLLSFGACNSGDTSLTDITKKGEIVMGLDDAFPPMGFRDENGNITGFDVDVATEVCARLGIKLVLQPIDWSQKESELNTKNVDMLWNGFTITPARQEALLFSDAYMNNRQVLVVKGDSSYQTAADLAGKKLGLQAGSSAASALASDADFQKSVTVVEFDDNIMALLDLTNGGVDVVLMDEIVANYYVTRGDNYRVLDKELAREEFGIGFRKADKALCEKINATLKEMAKDGKLAEISTKWFGKDVTTIAK